jgi:hypothetical protein
LIENPTANPTNKDVPGISNEPNPEASKHMPSPATEGTSNATRTGISGAEGLKTPAVRFVPFLSMPQSTQEELGKEVFDDPLLSVDNMKKLADFMQWCFKYTKVKSSSSAACLSRVVGVSDQSCLVCDRMLPIGLS